MTGGQDTADHGRSLRFSEPVAPGRPAPDVMFHFRIAAFICGLFYKKVTKRAGFISIVLGTVVAVIWIYVLHTPWGLSAMVPGGIAAFLRRKIRGWDEPVRRVRHDAPPAEVAKPAAGTAQP